MRQIFTIFWDSYRLLTAKKLFWIALGISVLIALLYASVKIGEDGISVLFGAYSFGGEDLAIPDMMGQSIYLSFFAGYVVPFWLGLFAIMLALISVCSVFPNFLEGGSIDIAVSKPIRRVTLFFTKYVSSLLFVAIQVFVFCVIIFIGFGLRMESWNFGIFWAVPLIVFVFSLIYSVDVLTAVCTKSTLLSLLTAFLVWGLSWGVHVLESWTYKLAYTAPAQGLVIDYKSGESEISEEPQEEIEVLAKVNKSLKMIGTPFPKTRDVTYLLKTKIKIDGKDLTRAENFLEEGDDSFTVNVYKAAESHANRHSDAYVIGTSLAFEAVILSLACFIFVRRDY